MTPEKTNTETSRPRVASRDEWLAERRQLLADEKAHTREYDRINAARRRLPMVRLEKEYAFDAAEGTVMLADLFADKKQLIVYHFMFDPAWDKGCGGCTSYVDALGDLKLLGERDTAFVLVSRAPLAKLAAYKAEKQWPWRWVSSRGSDFNQDFQVTLDKTAAPPVYNFRDDPERSGEQPGTSVFFRAGDDLFHTYSVYARGGESLCDSYRLLDITPYGRQEDFENSPPGWPQKPTYG